MQAIGIADRLLSPPARLVQVVNDERAQRAGSGQRIALAR